MGSSSRSGSCAIHARPTLCSRPGNAADPMARLAVTAHQRSAPARLFRSARVPSSTPPGMAAWSSRRLSLRRGKSTLADCAGRQPLPPRRRAGRDRNQPSPAPSPHGAGHRAGAFADKGRRADLAQVSLPPVATRRAMALSTGPRCDDDSVIQAGPSRAGSVAADAPASHQGLLDGTGQQRLPADGRLPWAFRQARRTAGMLAGTGCAGRRRFHAGAALVAVGDRCRQTAATDVVCVMPGASVDGRAHGTVHALSFPSRRRDCADTGDAQCATDEPTGGVHGEPTFRDANPRPRIVAETPGRCQCCVPDHSAHLLPARPR